MKQETLNTYIQRQCPALANHTELSSQECDELLDESKKEPEKLFNILWLLNALCNIKQVSSKFRKSDFTTLLAF